MSTTTADTDLLGHARRVGVQVCRGYHDRLTVAAELETRGVAGQVGYRSTARLLEDLWSLDPAAATRLLRHAAALTPRVSLSGEVLPAVLPATATAVADGTITDEHVEVIDRALSKIRDVPAVSPDDEEAAEALLAEAATAVAPAGLRRVAARLVDTLDPDGAAPPEEDEPIDEMDMTRRRRDKAVRFAGILHGVEGESFFEVIDAMSTPAGPDDTRSLSQRRAEAISDLIAQALSPTGVAPRSQRDGTNGEDGSENGDGRSDHDHSDSADPDRVEDPHAADEADRTRAQSADADTEDADTEDAEPEIPEARRGRNAPSPHSPEECATVPVRGGALLTLTMDYGDLVAGVGHGLLDSGLAVTPQTVRRLACDAGIVPVVLGSRSEPLDVGRRSYATTESIRRALHQRDRGCTFPGCTRRPRRCHAHHIRHWLDDGPTALHNMTLLCRYHHYLIHHSDWTIAMINGRPWYTPPAWLDPTRTPRPGGVDTTLAG